MAAGVYTPGCSGQAPFPGRSSLSTGTAPPGLASPQMEMNLLLPKFPYKTATLSLFGDGPVFYERGPVSDNRGLGKARPPTVRGGPESPR